MGRKINTDITRLPKWAQAEITRLTANINYYKEKLAGFEGEVKTNVFIREGLDTTPLPKDSHIEFSFGETHIDKVLVSKGKDYIEVMAWNLGIEPRACNIIRVHLNKIR